MSRSAFAASFLVVALTAFARAPRQAAPPQPQAPGPMTWVATLKVGSKWDAAKMPQQQTGFAEHVAGVQKLAQEGKLLVGGPFLDGSEAHKVTGAMWIVLAADADAAKKLVETDPWVKGDQLQIEGVRSFMAAGGAWVAASKPAAPPPAK